MANSSDSSNGVYKQCPDHGAARLAFSGFNEVGREDHFYRTANLLFLIDWIWELNVVRTFKLKYYRLGNPEAIYQRDMYEFFMLQLLEEGMEELRLVSERGCELANYVHDMLNLAFCVDERGNVHNYPSFTHEHVDRMSHMIKRWELGGLWDNKKPAQFEEILGNIYFNSCFDCWCFKAEPGCVVSLDGITTIWRYDRCFWQYEAWRLCADIHLCDHEWPIDD